MNAEEALPQNRLEQLIRRWNLSDEIQAEVRDFFNSPTGNFILELLKEINRPEQPQQGVPGASVMELLGVAQASSVGYQKCLDQLVLLQQGRLNLANSFIDVGEEFGHYGAETADETSEN